MEIPSNFSQPNGCDIIYREDRLMPEIFMEYAALKQLKTLSLPNANTALCQVGI